MSFVLTFAVASLSQTQVMLLSEKKTLLQKQYKRYCNFIPMETQTELRIYSKLMSAKVPKELRTLS